MKGNKLGDFVKERLSNQACFTVSHGLTKYVFESARDSITCSLFSEGVFHEKILIDVKINRYDVYDAILTCGQHDKTLCSTCDKRFPAKFGIKKCRNVKKRWFKKVLSSF